MTQVISQLVLVVQHVENTYLALVKTVFAVRIPFQARRDERGQSF